MRQGFTLIELSIVLVIIGLIAGGILVGQDMISAAETRSQITQIEQFHTAVRTFQAKYGFLPGDMPATPAARFGFAPRGSSAGKATATARSAMRRDRGPLAKLVYSGPIYQRLD